MTQIRTDPFERQLRVSAARHAQVALATLPDGDDMLFALHAGIALEHALKAVLASRHPVLIAASDFDSLLHACGESSGTRIPRHRMRTITARESLARVGQLVPHVKNLESQLAPLFEARNSVAHLADPTATDELRVPFIRAAEHLRVALEIAPQDFWGTYQAVVDAALAEEVQEARMRVEGALAGARGKFERRYQHLETAARDAVLDIIETSYSREKYEQELVECPACQRQALASGATETGWERDGDDGNFVARFTPGYLICRVCDLELDGEDELQIAGVQVQWEVEDADPADFYEPEY